jgi:hypothetical protein
MTRRSAKEIKKYKKRLNIPFHRFHITDSGTSNQHTMLLALDDGKNNVFYAAPRFDSVLEINDAWVAKEVAGRSIFVSPQEIGVLDDELHHVAFDAKRTFICSEPKEIKAITAAQLVDRLRSRLEEDPRPLRETVAGLLGSANAAVERAQVRIRQRENDKAGQIGIPKTIFVDPPLNLPASPRVPVREPEPLSVPNRMLRDLADKAYTTFDVQLVIVQPAAQKE